MDLIRHLWIDGYLERKGLPHYSREGRVQESRDGLDSIGKQTPEDEFAKLVQEWWGKPMTLKQAIELGLGLRFPLECGCPLEVVLRPSSAVTADNRIPLCVGQTHHVNVAFHKTERPAASVRPCLPA